MEKISRKKQTEKSGARKNVRASRVFNGLECRYLSQEARLLASSLLHSQSVSPETTERAIHQALLLGRASESSIDGETFESLVEAVAMDPSFTIPIMLLPSMPPSGNWVC